MNLFRPIPWHRTAFRALSHALILYLLARLLRALVSRDHRRNRAA